MDTKKYLALNAIGIVIIIGILIWFSASISKAPEQQETPTPTSTPTVTETSSVKIALLDYSATQPGLSRGCDRVILVDRTVATTSMPLTAALTALFATNETEGTLNSFIPKTAATLSFNQATVDQGTAKIYLTGSLSGLAGVCDDPRTKIQIEETAKQFPSVQNVEIYLNNQLTDLQPSQQ